MKYLFVLLLAGIHLFSCASSNKQEAAAQTTIEEEIPPVPAGADSVEMIFDLKFQKPGVTKLVGMYEDQRFIVDSATIDANGHFEIHRDKLLPKGYYYFILPGQRTALQMLLDKDQRFHFEADVRNINGSAKVTGSTTMELFYDNARFEQGLNREIQKVSAGMRQPPNTPEFKAAKKKYDQIVAQIQGKIQEYKKAHPNNFFVKFKIAGQNPSLTYPMKPDGSLDTARQVYLYRNAFWKGYDFSEKDLLRTPVFVNKIKKFFTELVPMQADSIIKYSDMLVEMAGDNPDYYRSITNWIALHFEPGHTNFMDGEAIYSHIIKKYFTDEKATWATPEDLEKLRKRASEMELSLLNHKAQNVTAKDFNGQYQTLFDSKAPVLLVFIYSPDCEHCQKQTPKLVQVYNQWKDKGFDVYSIAANTNEKDWRNFHTRFGLPWRDVFDPTNASWYPKYFVDITPELYVLDKDRKIVYKNINVDQLPTVLRKLLK